MVEIPVNAVGIRAFPVTLHISRVKYVESDEERIIFQNPEPAPQRKSILQLGFIPEVDQRVPLKDLTPVQDLACGF